MLYELRWPLLIVIVLLLFCLWRLVASIRSLRVLKIAAYGVLVSALLMIGGMLYQLSLFEVLSYEATVATIRVEHDQGKRYYLYLDTGAAPRVFLLIGDEWRLEARQVQFKPWLPLPVAFKLDRLSSRSAVPSAADGAAEYSLRDDLEIRWFWRALYRGWVPGVKTRYGGGVYMPMVDGAVYKVLAGRSGLLAEPVNQAAKSAVAGWSF
jgi:hypothetical protein